MSSALACGLTVTAGNHDGKVAVIGAHADYRVEDYYFLRSQSPRMRSLVWKSRIRKRRSWSELIAYAAAIAFTVMTSAIMVRL